jgi:FMN phosphatase YigB (HAD superfamily)
MTLAIGLDLDGTTYDMLSALRDFIAEDEPAAREWPDPTTWNVWESWACSELWWLQVFHEAIDVGDLFTRGDCYPGALEAVDALHAAGHRVHVITHRPETARAQTADWLDKVQLPHASLTFTADKTTVPVDVMIEDNVDNCLAAVAAGGRAILMDRPWNRAWEFGAVGTAAPVDALDEMRTGDMLRATGWAHAIELVGMIDHEHGTMAGQVKGLGDRLREYVADLPDLRATTACTVEHSPGVTCRGCEGAWVPRMPPGAAFVEDMTPGSFAARLPAGGWSKPSLKRLLDEQPPARRPLRTPEQNEILGAFVDMLAGPTGDGAVKREAGVKPLWKVDDSHEAAAFRHVERWRGGEQADADSGCHPLIHAAWRLLAVAYREMHA